MPTSSPVPPLPTLTGSEAQASRRSPGHRWSYTLGADYRGPYHHPERRSYRAHEYARRRQSLLDMGASRQLVSDGRVDEAQDVDGGGVHVGSSATQSHDLVLPKWQPDAEVSACFVCKTQFSFFFRKHHCR